MADPIEEKVFANIATTLAGITTGNGYPITIPSVQRFRQSGVSLATLPTAVFQWQGTAPASEEPYGVQDWRLDLVVAVLFVHDEAAQPTQTTDQVALLLSDSVKKALLVDRTRGGYAIDTTIGETEPIDIADENRLAGVAVGVAVKFRHRYGDGTVAI